MAVNWDVVKGKWNQLKGDVRLQWGKLTDDDWEEVAGQRDKLVGRIQEHYGLSQEEAEHEIDAYFGNRPRD